jgi:hypothetical protein
MKYLIALLIFFGMITFTLVMTPASHAQTVFMGTPGGNMFVRNPNFNCFNGFCNHPNFNPGFFQPGFAPVFTTPIQVFPVIINDTGAFDNIYGPGASPARRLGAYRNTNLYHGW